MRTLISISLGLLLAGCPDLPEGRFQCANDAQCPGSMQCSLADNRCYSVLPDAGVTDASDGAVTDASDGSMSVTPIVTDCTLQGESGSRAFAIAQIATPTVAAPEAPLPTVGFNVDGLTSTSTDLAGCNEADLTDGVDNGDAVILRGLGGIFGTLALDFNSGYQRAIDAGTVDLEIVLGDWNLTTDDACVSVTLQGEVYGAPIAALTGRAPLTGAFVDVVSLGGNVTIVSTQRTNPDAGACPSGCVDVQMPLQGVLARLRFSPDLTNIVTSSSSIPNTTNSSTLGGYVRWVGADELAYAPSYNAFLNAVSPELPAVANQIFGNFLDLDSTPPLTGCTAVGNTTSADSFSVGLLISSTPP